MLPVANPVTKPVEFTVAIFVFDDVHPIFLFVVFAGKIDAINCMVVAVVRFKLGAAGLNEIEAAFIVGIIIVRLDDADISNTD